MGRKRISLNEFLDRLESIFQGEYKYIDNYRGISQTAIIEHNCDDKTRFTPVLSSLLLGNTGCPTCSRSVAKNKTTEEYKNDVKLLTNNEYELVSTYENIKTIVTYRHKHCNTEFRTTPLQFKRGKRCPSCSMIKTNK